MDPNCSCSSTPANAKRAHAPPARRAAAPAALWAVPSVPRVVSAKGC
uniref:Uncharacterized protein n=1 Tax=Saimiri boliviensis boliviensis TaxID=39432 RepID=A0A2K6STD5_SAIBB